MCKLVLGGGLGQVVGWMFWQQQSWGESSGAENTVLEAATVWLRTVREGGGTI